MAKVKLTPGIREIRGKLGDVVFRVSPSGETFISKAPTCPRSSEARRKRRIARASKKRSPMPGQLWPAPVLSVRAAYEQQAAEQDRKPFRVAVSDYLKGNDLLAKK